MHPGVPIPTALAIMHLRPQRSTASTRCFHWLTPTSHFPTRKLYEIFYIYIPKRSDRMSPLAPLLACCYHPRVPC